MNWCYLFSGQGAQKVGFLDDAVAKYSEFLENIRIAEKTIDRSLEPVFRSGPQEKLNQTIYTQTFLFIYGYTLAKIIEKITNFRPQYCAGLSIGEYTALCFANALTFEDGVKLVYNRANLMHKSCIAKKGIMFALLGATIEVAKGFCAKLSEFGVIEVSNYNSQVQVVIGCEENLKEMVLSECKNFGIKKAVQLPVEGAFHTKLMEYAAQNLSFFIDNTKLQDAQIPVISNVTAKEEVKVSQIKDNLKKQIISPVLWYDAVLYLRERGVNNFIELGPGGILSDLVKKIHTKSTVYRVDSLNDLENAISILKS